MEFRKLSYSALLVDCEVISLSNRCVGCWRKNNY